MRSHHDLQLFQKTNLTSLDLICTCKKMDEELSQLTAHSSGAPCVDINLLLDFCTVDNVPAYNVSMSIDDKNFVFHPRSMTPHMNSFFSIPIFKSSNTKLRVNITKNGEKIVNNDFKNLAGSLSLMCKLEHSDDSKIYCVPSTSMYNNSERQNELKLLNEHQFTVNNNSESYYYNIPPYAGLHPRVHRGLMIRLAQNPNIDENASFWFPLRYCNHFDLLTPDNIMLESKNCINTLNELNMLPIPLNAYISTSKTKSFKSLAQLQALVSYLESYHTVKTDDEYTSILFTNEELEELKTPAMNLKSLSDFNTHLENREKLRNSFDTTDHKLFRKVRELVRELSSDKLDVISFKSVLTSPFSNDLVTLLEYRKNLTDELQTPRQFLTDVNNHRAKFLTLEAIDDCLRRCFAFSKCPTTSVVPFKCRQLQQLKANNEYNSVELSENVYQNMHQILTLCNQFDATSTPMLSLQQLHDICETNPSSLVQNVWRGIILNSAAQCHGFPIARSDHFSYSARMNIDPTQHECVNSLKEKHSRLTNSHSLSDEQQQKLHNRLMCQKLCTDFVQFDIVHRIIPFKTGQFILHVLNDTVRDNWQDDNSTHANYQSMLSLLDTQLQPLFKMACGAEESTDMPSLSFVHESFQMLPSTGYDTDSLLAWNLAHANT